MADAATPLIRDLSKEIFAARTRLGGVATNRRFGVIRLWPDQAVAEHENVERLKAAASLLGVQVVELDRLGGIIAEDRRPPTYDELDFVLHLHFETPKAYAPISVGALWNPFQFYLDWGFERYWANQISHDLFAWTGSESLRALIASRRGEAAAARMPLLNHTLSDPVYVPLPRERYDAFYCGINWERIGRTRGRHQGLLKELDRRGRLRLYGPEKVSGVAVWEGFKSYIGPLPFDGRTVVQRVRDAGAALVFSSDAHKASNIMSNRLFETLAAGAVVIGDDHPFLRSTLRNNYIQVPLNEPETAQSDFIIEALDDLGRDPERAAALANATQETFVKSFYLTNQLVDLFEAVALLKSERQERMAAQSGPLLDVVIQLQGRPENQASEVLRRIQSTLQSSASLVVIAEQAVAEHLLAEKYPNVVLIPSGTEKVLFSPLACYRLAKPHLRTRRVCFLLGIETILGPGLLAAANELHTAPVLRMGHVLRHLDTTGKPQVDFFSSADAVGDAARSATGSYIFDQGWLASLPPIDIGAAGLSRLASRQGHPVSLFDPTCLSIDLKAYEELRGAYGWTGLGSAESKLVDQLAAKVELGSGQREVVNFTPSAFAPIEDDLQNELHRIITTLPDRTYVDLASRLYRALRLPSWLSSFVRFVGRRVVARQ